MDALEYQKLARRTVKDGKFHPPTLHCDIDLWHAVIGLVTEAGEFQEGVEQYITAAQNTVYGGEPKTTNLIEEIGDLSWYHSLGCAAINVSVADIFSLRHDIVTDKNHVYGEHLVQLSTHVSTSAARMMDVVKRSAFYGRRLEIPKVQLELIRIAHLMDQSCQWLDTSLQEARRKNIAKLKVRYPETFTDYDAINRNIEEEQKVLAQA